MKSLHDATEDTARTFTKKIVELQAQELNQLSKTEREQVFYEIHGVADVIPEDDPTFVMSKLVEFDREIDRLSKIDTAAAAYKQAASSSPKYVKKTEFRLLFLRGDRFDVVAAAARMISFFEAKLDIFGPEKLTKDITLQDYDEDDLKCLKTGFMQAIKAKSGRAVLFAIPSLLGNSHGFTLQSKLRALWYVYKTMIEDIDVQRQGFVWVNYSVGINGQSNIERHHISKYPKLVKALPGRATGVHMCYNSSRWQILTHLVMLVCGKRLCTHLRVHFGTHKEVQSQLASFGIPCDGEGFLIGPDGELRRHTKFLKMVEMWQKQDEKALMVKMDTTLIVPGPNDVLLGRQKVVQEHSGNLHFRFLVNSYLDAYDTGTKRVEKTEISNNIVRIVKETNKGRFLKMEDDSGFWVEVDDKTACRKVAHTFRNQRSKISSTQQEQVQQQPPKVRLRASVEEEEEDGSSTIKPSKTQRRMEEEECGPSKTDG